MSPRRPRRRVWRPSSAAHIDRSADTPHRGAGADADAGRRVLLDPEADDEPEGLEYLLANRPPHYGGD